MELKPAVYRVANRDANPGYSEYQDNAERVSSLATIFPVIFFLIAALVSLTTMTRMIDEKRSEIGTLKALGYRNWEIGQKFLLYSSAAGITGAVLGLAVGFFQQSSFKLMDRFTISRSMTPHGICGFH